MPQRFIPVITSQAGTCLTMANWQAVGVTIGTFYLDALLMKPGLAVLSQVGSVKSYYAWGGEVVLNANLSKPDKQGNYVIRSHYDGELIKLDSRQLRTLILNLQPDYLVLSRHSLAQFSQEIWPDSIQLLSDSQYRVVSASGDRCDCWLESDKPAADAIVGRVYCEQGVIDILQPQYSKQFTPLSTACPCPTCSQGFTRAYLHHLLQQTPLLAQRYLIQHNLFISLKHKIP